MTSVLRWTSVVLFSLLSLFMIAFGGLYASVENLLWFHAAAVPADAQEAVRPIYFALMKLVGGFSIGLGVLALWTALGEVRRGAPAAALLVAVALAIPVAMAGYVAEHLRETTGAPTSWNIMLVLLAVDAAALLAALAGRKRG